MYVYVYCCKFCQNDCWQEVVFYAPIMILVATGSNTLLHLIKTIMGWRFSAESKVAHHNLETIYNFFFESVAKSLSPVTSNVRPN